VLRHPLEARRRTNSARVAALALPALDIATLGPAGPPPLDPARDALLYPGGGEWEGPPPARLVVLDGSWREARRMLLRHRAIAGLRRFSLKAPPVAPARLRRQNRRDGMATFEAIARALERLEGAAVAAPLLALFSLFVSRSVASARRVGLRPSPRNHS
jgi:DTW domain-containing protein YfiP